MDYVKERDDRPGGQVHFSVPASEVSKLDSALVHLAELHHEAALSRLMLLVVYRAAEYSGWKSPTPITADTSIVE